MIYKYKESIGIAFFVIAILMLIYMVLSPLTNVFIHPDEFFTLGMIKFSFLDILTATSIDTHPPGYYYILKMFIIALDMLHIGYDVLFVTKLLSILPYVLIILVSFTKLRKEYGWFTSGMFVFAIALMSGFYFQFLTVRMYNWGLLFLLMSFIYFKDIINDSSIKSWVIFSLFTAAVFYTHYFICFSSALIYLSLLGYLFIFCKDNLKEELKKFVGSIVLVFLLYVPWLGYFIAQMTSERSPHNIPPVDFGSLVSSGIYFLTANELFMIKVLAVLFTLFLIVLIVKEYRCEPTAENYYVGCGFLVFFGTILISAIVSQIYEPILLPRYLIPSAAVIWLSISILIGKINNNRLFTISLIFLLIFGFLGFVDINSNTPSLNEYGIKCQDMFDEINSDSDAIIIFDGSAAILDFKQCVDIKSYSPPTPVIFGVNNTTAHEIFDFEEKSPEEIEFMANYSDNKTYYIDAWGSFELNNTNMEKIGQIASAKFYRVDKN
jgi:hypothetical protein